MNVLHSLMAVVAVMLFCCCGTNAGAIAATGQFSTPNKSYTIRNNIQGQTISLGRNTTLIFDGGKMINCTVIGSGTKVVVNGEATVFEGCTFQGSFANSRLSATNFGCKPDMKARSYSWKFKSQKATQTTIHTGTDNKRALDALAQFCSHSTGVTIHFNGDFFTPVVDNRPGKSEGRSNKMVITGAKNLELYGGSLIQGIYVYDSDGVSIHDMKFLGLHGVHDFPPVYHSKASFKNGSRVRGYSIDQAYNITSDQYNACGLAIEGVRFMASEGKQCNNLKVSNCHFEMRMSGIMTGEKAWHANVNNLTVSNCTFSHIYFQPIGLHGSHTVVDGVQADYCLQGIDFSTGCSNSVVRNSRFTNCFTGPKQDTSTSKPDQVDYSHDNSIDNVYYQIGPKFNLIDYSPNILDVSQGRAGDVFKFDNVTMDVNHDRLVGGIMNRANNLRISNLKLNININISNNSKNYEMLRLFTTGGGLVNAKYSQPAIQVYDSQLNLNARVAYIAAASSVSMSIALTGVKVAGNKGCNYTCFHTLSSVALSNVIVTCPVASISEKVSSVSADRLSLKASKSGFVFNQDKPSSCVIKNSQIEVALSLVKSSAPQRLTVDCSDNTLKCSNVVAISSAVSDQSSTIKVTRNNITATGASIITGGKNMTSRMMTAQNFDVSGNDISSTKQATLIDTQVPTSLKGRLRNNRVSASVRLP